MEKKNNKIYTLGKKEMIDEWRVFRKIDMDSLVLCERNVSSQLKLLKNIFIHKTLPKNRFKYLIKVHGKEMVFIHITDYSPL